MHRLCLSVVTRLFNNENVLSRTMWYCPLPILFFQSSSATSMDAVLEVLSKPPAERGDEDIGECVCVWTAVKLCHSYSCLVIIKGALFLAVFGMNAPSSFVSLVFKQL